MWAKSSFLKIAAVFTLITFCVTSTGWAQPPSPAPPTLAVNHHFLIPEALGAVDESYNGKSGKTILYIQDAHDSLEAQENIAKIIQHLVEEKGVKTVFEEGYEGKVPTDEYFGFIKDKEVKEKVSYFLMDKLRIGGAEYAHINRKRDFNLIGADSIKLHLENIEWYRKSAQNKEQTDKDLKALQHEISKLAHQHFPKALKKWMKHKKRFDEGKLDLLNYLKRTGSSLPLSNYPMIALLLSVEKAMDKTTKEKVSQLDSKALFKEINRLEDDFAQGLLTNERDQQIFNYHKKLSLLRRLSEIEVTPAEYEAVKDTLQDFNTRQLAEFMIQQTTDWLVLSKQWEQNIKSAIQFYETAHKRDHSIEKQLDEFLNAEGEDKAVLVFGGFHKNNIQEILREKNISYQIISPKIKKISKKHQKYYKQLMSVGHYQEELPRQLTHAAAPQRVFSRVPKNGFESYLAHFLPAELSELVRSELRSEENENPYKSPKTDSTHSSSQDDPTEIFIAKLKELGVTVREGFYYREVTKGGKEKKIFPDIVGDRTDVGIFRAADDSDFIMKKEVLITMTGKPDVAVLSLSLDEELQDPESEVLLKNMDDLWQKKDQRFSMPLYGGVFAVGFLVVASVISTVAGVLLLDSSFDKSFYFSILPFAIAAVIFAAVSLFAYLGWKISKKKYQRTALSHLRTFIDKKTSRSELRSAFGNADTPLGTGRSELRSEENDEQTLRSPVAGPEGRQKQHLTAAKVSGLGLIALTTIFFTPQAVSQTPKPQAPSQIPGPQAASQTPDKRTPLQIPGKVEAETETSESEGQPTERKKGTSVELSFPFSIRISGQDETKSEESGEAGQTVKRGRQNSVRKYLLKLYGDLEEATLSPTPDNSKEKRVVYQTQEMSKADTAILQKKIGFYSFVSLLALLGMIFLLPKIINRLGKKIEAQPKRARFQFSLRSLFLVTAFVATFMAFTMGRIDERNIKQSIRDQKIVVEQLEVFFDGDDSKRQAVIKKIEQKSFRDYGIDILLWYLKHGNNLTREDAFLALVMLEANEELLIEKMIYERNIDVQDAMLSALTKEAATDQAQRRVIEGFGKSLRNVSDPEFAEKMVAAIRNIYRKNSKMGSAITVVLLEVLEINSHEFARSQAAVDLGYVRDNEKDRGLELRVMNALIDAVKNEEGIVRLSAMSALGERSTTGSQDFIESEGVEALRDALKSDNDRIRWKAIEVLGTNWNLNPQMIIKDLIKQLRSDRSADNRSKTVEALSYIATTTRSKNIQNRIVTALIQAAKSESSRSWRKRILDSLNNLSPHGGQGKMIDKLREDDAAWVRLAKQMEDIMVQIEEMEEEGAGEQEMSALVKKREALWKKVDGIRERVRRIVGKLGYKRGEGYEELIFVLGDRDLYASEPRDLAMNVIEILETDRRLFDSLEMLDEAFAEVHRQLEGYKERNDIASIGKIFEEVETAIVNLDFDGAKSGLKRAADEASKIEDVEIQVGNKTLSLEGSLSDLITKVEDTTSQLLKTHRPPPSSVKRTPPAIKRSKPSRRDKQSVIDKVRKDPNKTVPKGQYRNKAVPKASKRLKQPTRSDHREAGGRPDPGVGPRGQERSELRSAFGNADTSFGTGRSELRERETDKPEMSRRQWLQFSLKSLMITTTAASLGMGTPIAYETWKFNRKYNSRKIEDLEKKYLEIAFDEIKPYFRKKNKFQSESEFVRTVDDALTSLIRIDRYRYTGTGDGGPYLNRLRKKPRPQDLAVELTIKGMVGTSGPPAPLEIDITSDPRHKSTDRPLTETERWRDLYWELLEKADVNFESLDPQEVARWVQIVEKASREKLGEGEKTPGEKFLAENSDSMPATPKSLIRFLEMGNNVRTGNITQNLKPYIIAFEIAKRDFFKAKKYAETPKTDRSQWAPESREFFRILKGDPEIHKFMEGLFVRSPDQPVVPKRSIIIGGVVGLIVGMLSGFIWRSGRRAVESLKRTPRSDHRESDGRSDPGVGPRGQERSEVRSGQSDSKDDQDRPAKSDAMTMEALNSITRDRLPALFEAVFQNIPHEEFLVNAFIEWFEAERNRSPFSSFDDFMNRRDAFAVEILNRLKHVINPGTPYVTEGVPIRILSFEAVIDEEDNVQELIDGDRVMSLHSFRKEPYAGVTIGTTMTSSLLDPEDVTVYSVEQMVDAMVDYLRRDHNQNLETLLSTATNTQLSIQDIDGPADIVLLKPGSLELISQLIVRAPNKRDKSINKELLMWYVLEYRFK